MSWLKRYGVLGLCRLARDLALTRLLQRGARLVRRPVYIRNAGRIRLGRRLTTGVGCRLEVVGSGSHVSLSFGDDVEINDYVHIGALERVSIGHRVLIASRVFISDHNHGRYDAADPSCAPDVPPGARPIFGKPVVIEDDVWIGEQVCILPGVTIGAGAIVGAGSIVTRSVPPRSIVAGNPAHIVRVYDSASGRWEKP